MVLENSTTFQDQWAPSLHLPLKSQLVKLIIAIDCKLKIAPARPVVYQHTNSTILQPIELMIY